MQLARVIGSIWATRKQAALETARFVLLQPVNEQRAVDGDPLAALDTLGSGPGDLVLYVTAYEAVLPWLDRCPGVERAGLDAAVVAIVDALGPGAESSS